MTSHELEKRTPQQALAAQIRDNDRIRSQIVEVLPENVTFQRFARVAGLALLDNPDLAEADRESFFLALVKCAADGLVPDGRQAFLGVYKNSKTGAKTVSYQPMVHGLRDAVADYGWDLTADGIREHDDFDYNDDPANSWVKPGKPRDPRTKRGDLISAWAYAQHTDGRKRLVVLGPDDVARCKAKARTDSFWKAWPDAMWAKTAAKKLAKNLPLAQRESDRLHRMLVDTNGEQAITTLYGSEDRSGAAQAPAVQAGEAGGRSPASPLPNVDTTTGEIREPEDAGPPDEPFDGDEPAEELEGEVVEQDAPVFTAGRHEGMTIQEIYELGEPGVKYLSWALKQWKTAPLSDALAAFAEEHPEIAS